MVCTQPIKGYRTPTGQVSFAKRHGWSDLESTVPCGQCTGCRLEYSRQWAMRIMHESTCHEDNVFLTLTYSDEHLPANRSLVPRDTQLFLKRLRKHFDRKNKKIRFYLCGEYGDTTLRPHYHAICFGLDLPDKTFLKESETGHPIYISKLLDHIWGLGDCYIGSVTFESAAYCGRYVMKKLTGSRKSEYGDLQPEFSRMSRNPGVGKLWLEKWNTDVYPNDFVIMNGVKVKVPKYYDTQVEDPKGLWETDHTGWPIWRPHLKSTATDKRRQKRKRSALKHSHDNSPERLKVREEIQQLRIQRLTRKF